MLMKLISITYKENYEKFTCKQIYPVHIRLFMAVLEHRHIQRATERHLPKYRFLHTGRKRTHTASSCLCTAQLQCRGTPRFLGAADRSAPDSPNLVAAISACYPSCYCARHCLRCATRWRTSSYAQSQTISC